MFSPTSQHDIEREVSGCATCNALKPHQTKEPLQLHDIPDLPRSLTSATLISKLKRHFATHGVPRQRMTDDAASFASRDFQEFAHTWDFSHITSSPHCPQPNRLAERAVRSAKHLLMYAKTSVRISARLGKGWAKIQPTTFWGGQVL